jgi:hypothetical protein
VVVASSAMIAAKAAALWSKGHSSGPSRTFNAGRNCSPSSPAGSTKPLSGTLPSLRIGRHICFIRTMREEWLQGRVP